jgi:hypothetical protein
MNACLDWQIGDENGGWETISAIEKHTKHKAPRWTWYVLLTLLALLTIAVAGGWFVLQHRYNRALHRVTLQIQDAIDLEARALERGNVDLFLAQQDETSPAWYARQAQRARTRCPQPGSVSQDILQEHCPPVPAAVVQSVELRGDIAWVEVLSGQEQVRQVCFYRQTELGWKHTAPRAEFWKGPVEWTHGPVVVQCRERDLPHIEPLIEHISTTVGDLCAVLDCPSDSALEVDFFPRDRPPHLSGHRLTLASPWLSGIPADGDWDQAYLDRLTYWAAYRTMLQATPDPTRLQRAVLGECATLYAHGHITQDPILGPAIEQCGAVLPEALRSADRAETVAPSGLTD